MGRLAASEDVAPLAGLRDVEWSLTSYTFGRLIVDVIPMLTGDEVWEHPLCAAFDGTPLATTYCRNQLVVAAMTSPIYVQ